MNGRKHLFMIITIVIAFVSLSGIINGEAFVKDKIYIDGIYEESAVDELGYKSIVKLEIRDGRIFSVKYNELSSNGISKIEDEEYSKVMENTLGIGPKDAYLDLENQLIKTQDIDKVDVISRATVSSEKFKELVKKIIK